MAEQYLYKKKMVLFATNQNLTKKFERFDWLNQLVFVLSPINWVI